MLERDLTVYEDDQELTITYKWFTPVAFFLLFFCIGWDAFLVNWYWMGIGSGAPLIMFIFPLIHVAVGLGLSYYTLCLFFNKTIFNVSDGRLHIVHMPFPWWKGNRKFDTDNIEQFYVKEKKGQKGSVSYELRAKMMDGKDISMVSVGVTESHRLQELEEKLERFIGIKDSAVKGEYGAKTKVEQQATARRKRKTASQQFNFTVGQYTQFKNDSQYVNHNTQYDWLDGTTDYSVQLLSDADKTSLLYIKENMGVSKPWSEQKIPLYKTAAIAFQPKSPARFIEYQGLRYALNEHLSGHAFVTNVKQAVDTEQWRYQSLDGKKHLRIKSNLNILAFYLGEALQLSDFGAEEDNLELRELDREYRDNSYEDDFL